MKYLEEAERLIARVDAVENDPMVLLGSHNRELRKWARRVKRLASENARLRTQNAKLAEAAGEMRQYICDVRESSKFVNVAFEEAKASSPACGGSGVEE